LAQTATQIATDSVAAILSSTSEVTNMNVGTLIRSLIDADAAISAVQEQQIEDQVTSAVNNVLLQALGQTPVDATGSVYLLQLSLSSSATTSYTFAAGTAVTIPNSSLQWVTSQSVTVAPNSSTDVTATCTTVGIITNVPANIITQFVSPIANATVTNPSAQPIVAGQDAGTSVQLQAQIANAISELQAGIDESIESTALKASVADSSGNPVEVVAKAKFYNALTPAEGYCYVDNGVSTASTTLLSNTLDLIDGYIDTNGNVIEGVSPAGSIIYVVDAPQTSVTVSVAVLPAYGYTLSAIQTGVQYAIQQFFAQLDLASTVSLQQLAYAILAVPGVSDTQIISPTTPLPAIPYVTAPTAAPALTAITGTTNFTAATYTVGYTFTNPWGETTVSSTATVALTAGQAIQVGGITLPTGATGINYYVSDGGGTAIYLDGSSAGAQTTISALPTSATVPPTANTAMINGNAYVLSSTPTVSLATS
jgi:hypothetical protein